MLNRAKNRRTLLKKYSNQQILSSGPILKLPDLERNFIVQADASNVSIGGCLLRERDGIKHPVMYASAESRIIQSWNEKH